MPGLLEEPFSNSSDHLLQFSLVRFVSAWPRMWLEDAPADVTCSMSVCSFDHYVLMDEFRVCSLLFCRLWHSVTLLEITQTWLHG